MKRRIDSKYKKVTIRKRVINADSIQEFRDILSEVDLEACIQYLTPTMAMNVS